MWKCYASDTSHFRYPDNFQRTTMHHEVLATRHGLVVTYLRLDFSALTPDVVRIPYIPKSNFDWNVALLLNLRHHLVPPTFWVTTRHIFLPWKYIFAVRCRQSIRKKQYAQRVDVIFL